MGGLRILWKSTIVLGIGSGGAVLPSDVGGNYIQFEPRSGADVTAYFFDCEAISGGGSLRIIPEYHEQTLAFPVIVIADNVGNLVTTTGLTLIPFHTDFDGSTDSAKNAVPPITRIAFAEASGTNAVTVTGTLYAVFA